MYTAENICRMTELLIDDIFVQFGGCFFHRVIRIPAGTNCAPLLFPLLIRGQIFRQYYQKWPQ